MEVEQFTRCVPAENLRPDIILTYAMEENLHDDLVTIRVLNPTGDDHTAEFCCASDTSSERSDGFIKLLGHLPHVHSMDSLEYFRHGDLLHGINEQLGGDKGAEVPHVVDPLQQVSGTCSYCRCWLSLTLVCPI